MIIMGTNSKPMDIQSESKRSNDLNSLTEMFQSEEYKNTNPYRNMVTSKLDYGLDPDRSEHLSDITKELIDLEFWHPRYQAWENFLNWYITSGCDPAYNLSWGESFFNKRDFLEQKHHSKYDLLNDIILIYNTSADVFTTCLWDNLLELYRDIVFFRNNRFSVMRQLRTSDIYNSTLKNLLDLNTWRGVACAIYLYRHCQIDGMKWGDNLIADLKNRINVWVKEFSFEFESIRDFLGDKLNVYHWFSEDIHNIIVRAWSTCLMLENRPLPISANDFSSKTMPEYVKEEITRYITSSPVVYNDPLEKLTVSNSLFNTFYPDNEEDTEYINQAYFSLCIPDKVLSNNFDIMFNFLNIMEEGNLTLYLYNRKKIEYDREINVKVTPEQYLDDLYFRGFPHI